MAPRHPTDASWASYVHGFHAERPGITEHVLARCHADGVDPYGWCAQAVLPRPGPVLDVACGSGPMAAHLAGWIGADASSEELAVAAGRRRGPLLRASATGLPIRTAAIEATVCSMGMQVIDPVADALGEVGRILRRGGRAVVLLPTTRPLPLRHALVYARLQVALRRRIGYPNDELLRPAGLARLAATAGLAVASDVRRAFTLPLRDDADVDELLASLYLPGLGPRRIGAARRVLVRSTGGTLTVPLRRIVLQRTGAAA